MTETFRLLTDMEKREAMKREIEEWTSRGNRVMCNCDCSTTLEKMDDPSLAKKFDDDKPDHSLIDPTFLDELSYVLMYGVKEYGRDNWRKPGLSINRLCAAISRHCSKILSGVDIDDESHLYHAAHIAASAMFLVAHGKRGFPKGFDDRYSGPVPQLWSEDGRESQRKKSNVFVPILSERYQEGEGCKSPERLDVSTGVSALGSPHSDEKRTGGIATDSELHETQDTLGPTVLTDLAKIFLIKQVGKQSITEVFIPATDSISLLQQDIAAWADGLWPNRKAITALTKMQMEEIPELITGGIEASELADVGILLLDIAALKHIDLGKAIKEKMDINKKRTWKTDPHTGLAHHIKEEE